MSTVTQAPIQPPPEDTEHPHVVRVAGVPMLRGTRLSVRLIAQQHRAGDGVDEIVLSYPQLEPAAIHDAISYYLDHRAEIEQEIAAQRMEAVLARTGGQVDERGFVTFDAAPSDG
jgi:uncharacterized protein (DUF433 family)